MSPTQRKNQGPEGTEVAAEPGDLYTGLSEVWAVPEVP